MISEKNWIRVGCARNEKTLGNLAARLGVVLSTLSRFCNGWRPKDTGAWDERIRLVFKEWQIEKKQKRTKQTVN